MKARLVNNIPKELSDMEKIIKMYDVGVKLCDIRDLTGKSISSINHLISRDHYRHRLKDKKTLSNIRDHKICSVVKKNPSISLTKMGVKFGLSQSSIIRILAENNIKRENVMFMKTRSKIPIIKTMLKRGCTPTEIVCRLHTPFSTVRGVKNGWLK